MKTYIQVTLDNKEKVELEQAIQGQGFRSVASFAYYAVMQQLNELKKKRNPFGLSDSDLQDLKNSIEEKEYAEIDLDNI